MNSLLSLTRRSLLGMTTLALLSCDQSAPPTSPETAGDSNGRYSATDRLQTALADNLASLETVVVIDHSRLAEKEGVTMPPCVVTLVTHPTINTPLLKRNPRVGLDLPHKILVFEEKGQPTVSYPNSAFLGTRHGIEDSVALTAYDAAMTQALKGLPEDIISPVNDDGVEKDYGIVELVSDFDHQRSIERLKEAVMSQGDTVWFGEIDFQTEAGTESEGIPKATLLLFGGPKPGGVAMAEFPQLGLDAFCQKLLVYEDAGKVKVIFNDIAAMANLHYGTSSKPHVGINTRLTATFKGAVTQQDE